MSILRTQNPCLSSGQRCPDEILPRIVGVVIRSVEPFVARTGDTRGLDLKGDRLRTNPGVDNKELLDHVVDLLLHSLVAGIDIPDHLQ